MIDIINYCCLHSHLKMQLQMRAFWMSYLLAATYHIICIYTELISLLTQVGFYLCVGWGRRWGWLNPACFVSVPCVSSGRCTVVYLGMFNMICFLRWKMQLLKILLSMKGCSVCALKLPSESWKADFGNLTSELTVTGSCIFYIAHLFLVSGSLSFSSHINLIRQVKCHF